MTVATLAILAVAGVALAQQPPAPPVYRPGLGELMTTTVQPRHIKLGLAGRESNWGYAACELHELRESFNRAASAWPKWRTFAIADMIDSVTGEPMAALGQAIKAGDAAQFAAAYEQLTKGCNTCHQSADRGVIVIRRPEASSFPDQDFRAVASYRHETGLYDRIVSVGMFEHVGVGHYQEYFEKVRDLLTDDGVALIHTIGNTDGPGTAQPWIRKYIFPGGYTPALSEVVPAIERAGLYITDIEVLRLHYAETLRAWRQRFAANRARIASLYDERFCRMWEFYLAGCEAGFRHSGLVNFQIQLSKRIDSVPLTRTYMTDAERHHSDVAMAK